MNLIFKRLAAGLLALMVVAAAVPTIAFGGMLSAEAATEWIEISTPQELSDIRNNLAGNYILTNDIDLTEYTAGGAGWSPIGTFTGVLDGNGHAIIGLCIKKTLYSTDYSANLGLFSYIKGGTVKNLGMRDGRIEVTGGYPYVGFIAGLVDYGGTVTNCYNTGDIIGTSHRTTSTAGQQAMIGGIVGKLGNRGGAPQSAIDKCYNTGTISATASSDSHYTYAGGIAGRSEYSTAINNCYNTGDITASLAWLSGTYFGGSAGIAFHIYNYSSSGYYSTISCCYNLGKAYSSIGYSANGISACYYKADCAKYINGTKLTEEQLLDQSKYAGFDFSTTWMMDTTLNYPYPQLRSNTMNLTRRVESLVIAVPPTKTTYWTDEELDLTGGILWIIYANGDNETMPLADAAVTGFDPKTVGEQSLTVAHGGQEIPLVVTVVERPAITGISIATMPDDSTFVQNTVFDYTGATVLVTYETGETRTVPLTADMITNIEGGSVGTYIFTVSYEGFTIMFTMDVIYGQCEELTLKTPPTKLTYNRGDELDLTGMELIARFTDGREEVVSGGYQASGYEPYPGTYTVTVDFQGVTASFEVKVAGVLQVTAIEMGALPTRTEQVQNTTFVVDGATLLVTYENGKTGYVDITESMISGGDIKTLGDQTLTVTYSGFTTTFQTKVVPLQYTNLVLRATPTKTAYLEGEELDLTGMELMACFNDGREIAITNGYTVEGYTADMGEGTYTITLTYLAKSVSFDITVSAALLGDTNKDGIIDMIDAFAVFAAASGGTVSEGVALFGDMNSDGIVDMLDAFAVFRIASGE